MCELETHCASFVCNRLAEVYDQASFRFLLYNEKEVSMSLLIQEMIVVAIEVHISLDNCLDIHKCAKEVSKGDNQRGL